MEWSFEPRGRPVAVVALAGRVDFRTAHALEAALADLALDGWHHLVVDLSSVTALDSAALGALVSGLKALRNAGGDLRVAGMTAAVHARLRTSGLDRVLLPYATVAGAIADLAAEPAS